MKSILLWLFCFLLNGGMLLYLISKYSFNQEPWGCFLGFTIPVWAAYPFYIFTTLGSMCFLIEAIGKFYKKKLGGKNV